MSGLPRVIENYYQNKPIIEDSLKKESIIELLAGHIRLENRLKIEDIINIKNGLGIIVGYYIIKELCKQLKISHIEELFEAMLIIFVTIIEEYAKDECNKETVKCDNCGRIVLSPTDGYYYGKCYECDKFGVCSEYYYKARNLEENNECVHCGRSAAYYKLGEGIKAITSSDSEEVKLIADPNLYTWMKDEYLQSYLAFYNRHYCTLCDVCVNYDKKQHIIDVYNKYKEKYE